MVSLRICGGSEEGDYYENLVDKITEQSVSSSRIREGRGGDGDNKRDQRSVKTFAYSVPGQYQIWRVTISSVFVGHRH